MTNHQSGTGDATPGAMDSIRALLQALHDYFLVRCEMAGIESQAAFRKIARAALVFTVALICLGTGFLYLSLSMVWVLAEVADWGWGWALLTTGVVLLLIMAGGLFYARSILQGDWFRVTFAELKKDSAWLSQNTNRNA